MLGNDFKLYPYSNCCFFYAKGVSVVPLIDIEMIAPGITGLTAEENVRLLRFTLLWTLFEDQVLENNASARKIKEIIENLDSKVVDDYWFQEQLIYFKDRYTEEGHMNYRFDHLHLRNNDNLELVRSVLVGDNLDLKDQLIACLTIVYRFRNNFFHGLKWAYKFQEQFDNFRHSENLLKMCLEKFPHSI